MGSQIQIIESAGAEVPARRIHHDSHTGQNFGISARSQTPKSFATAIRADIGESEAYKQALLRGEIGLQRPMGANVRGVDFITAVREGATGIKNIICTDVKTSERGKFPIPKQSIPGSWQAEVHAAVARLKLQLRTTDATGSASRIFAHPPTIAELKVLESEVARALRENRVHLRQLNADYSETGNGTISGW